MKDKYLKRSRVLRKRMDDLRKNKSNEKERVKASELMKIVRQRKGRQFYEREGERERECDCSLHCVLQSLKQTTL